jgi:hypothetical protein
VELTSLRLMREKGIISQAEFDSAMRDLEETSGARAKESVTLSVGNKFAATLYGFVEADAIWDSTESFTDQASNYPIARPAFTSGKTTTAATYANANTRMQFSIRSSRLGIRVKSPSTDWFRASGLLEMDFEGATLPLNQGANTGAAFAGTEAAYFNTPTPRLRHAYVKFETPVVDILMGQYWHLYGWGNAYFPATLEIQGIVGQINSRTAQIRLSHAFKSDAVSFELAAAAMRPPSRNSGAPEGTAGFQLAFPKWQGMTTPGATGTRIQPASIAVTGDLRRFNVPEYLAKPVNRIGLWGQSFAVDAFLPVVPATEDRKGNSLSLTGEFSYGTGVADLYNGLTGGVPIGPGLAADPKCLMTAATLANVSAATLCPAPVFPADFDPGLVAFDPKGTGVASLPKWTSFNVGLQYYFPVPDGRLFIAGTFARQILRNASTYADPTGAAKSVILANAQKVRDHEDLINVSLFGDPYPGVRFGISYEHFADTYVDGVMAINHRAELSGYYIF